MELRFLSCGRPTRRPLAAVGPPRELRPGVRTAARLRGPVDRPEPDAVDELGDDDPEWLEVAKLLEHAKTL